MSKFLPDYIASHPRRQQYSHSLGNIMFQCFISNCYHTKIYIKNYTLPGTLLSTNRTLPLVQWCCHPRSLHNYQAGIRDGRKLRHTKVERPHNNIRYIHSFIHSFFLLVKTLTLYMSVPSLMKIQTLVNSQ